MTSPSQINITMNLVSMLTKHCAISYVTHIMAKTISPKQCVAYIQNVP